MGRNLQSIRGMFILLQRKAILLLILISSPAGMGQAIPVRAAPPAEEITNMRFYLNISSPQMLCAGREYSIRVTPLVELDGKRSNGEKFNYKDKIVPGVEITAEITDTNIATVDPAKPQSQKAGYLPRSLFETSSLEMQEKLGNLGEVVFKLKARKAGSTYFYLTAKVPRQWSGSQDRYFGPQGMPVGSAIRVVNCKYEVSMIYNWQYSFPAIKLWTIGTMNKVPLTLEDESLTGTGQVDFMRGAGGNPYCTYDISAGKSTVDMTGRFTEEPSGNGQVTVTFNYGDLSEVVAAKCTFPHFGQRSGMVDWSGPPPVAMISTAVFPDTGGSVAFQLQLGGSLTITLRPVPAQGGK